MPTKEKVHEHIKHSLMERILSGELKSGDRVPSEYELVEQLGVSRNQTRQALRELELDGWVVRRQGSGSFVSDQPVQKDGLGIQLTQKLTAIVLPEYVSEYSQTLIAGIMEALNQQNYQAVIYNVRLDEPQEYRFLVDAQRSGVSGLIFWPQHISDRIKGIVRSLAETGFAMVQLDRYLAGVEVDFTVSDNRDISARLTKALIDRGHRRIGFAGELSDVTSIAERFQGYTQTLQEAGIEPEDDWQVDVNMRRVEESQLHALMARRQPPTAFLCLHHPAALLMNEAMQNLGYQIPKDIELACPDARPKPDDPHYVSVTVQQDISAMGAQCGQLLLERIGEPDRAPQQRFIPAGPVISLD